MNTFNNKVAIITGGGTGIGRTIAEGIAGAGGKVLIVGRREAPLKATAEQQPDAIQYLQADITKQGITGIIIAHAVEHFGRLDIVINNAGYAAVKPLTEMTDADIDQQLDVNLKALIRLSRDAVSELAKHQGNIINISSVAGQTAVPGFSVYAATKSSGDRISKILANEFGPLGVRVNSVAPGLTDTDMVKETPAEVLNMLITSQTALRRLGTPGDVAKSILWLASDDANWVTGQILQASGGLLLS